MPHFEGHEAEDFRGRMCHHCKSLREQGIDHCTPSSTRMNQTTAKSQLGDRHEAHGYQPPLQSCFCGQLTTSPLRCKYCREYPIWTSVSFNRYLVCCQGCKYSWFDSLLNRYDMTIGENVSLISGSQAQWLQITCALAQPSRIQVFDKCTTSFENQAAVLETIYATKGGSNHMYVPFLHSLFSSLIGQGLNC